ncbi:MAG: hypothetical protein AAFP19_17860, partial [Bacteroidota bacterium]
MVNSIIKSVNNNKKRYLVRPPIRRMLSLVGSFCLLLFFQVDLVAQCAGTPCNASVPTGPVSIDIELTGASASLGNATLSSIITPAGGCGYPGGTTFFDFMVFDQFPSVGDMEPAGIRSFNCDSVGMTFVRYIVLEDNTEGTNDEYEECDATPIMITVNVSDASDPVIDDGMVPGPDCGETVMLETGSNYDYTMDPNSATPSATQDCISNMTWALPDGMDNCGIDSIAICFRAESSPAPSQLPATIVYGPVSNPVPVGTITIPLTSFYGNPNACTATTRVVYKYFDPSGAVDSCFVLVEVSDDQNPVWENPYTDSLGTTYNVLNEIESEIGSNSPDLDVWDDAESGEVVVILDCNDSEYSADSAYLASWLPTATDNCDTTLTATQTLESGPTVEDCNTPVEGVENVYVSFNNYFNVADECANELNHTSGDGTDDENGDDNRFRLRVFTADPDGPWLGPDSMGVDAPVDLDAAVATNPTSTGSKATGIDFAFTGDTIKYNIDGTMGCDFTISSDTLALTGLDCQSITYSWEVLSSFDNLGNTTSLSGVTSDVADDNDIVNGASTTSISTWPVGVHRIRYTAVDDCDNTSTFDFHLQICDTIAPVITDCPPANAVMDTICAIANTSQCETTVNWIIPSAMDCTGITSFTASAVDPGGNNLTINTANVPGGTCSGQVGFAGLFSPGNWNANTNGGGGIIDFSGAPTSLFITEDNALGVNTEATVNILESGVVSFSFDYDNTFGGPDDFGYVLNGTYVELAVLSKRKPKTSPASTATTWKP